MYTIEHHPPNMKGFNPQGRCFDSSVRLTMHTKVPAQNVAGMEIGCVGAECRRRLGG